MAVKSSKDQDSLSEVRKRHKYAKEALLNFIGDQSWSTKDAIEWAAWEANIDRDDVVRALWDLAARGEIVIDSEWRISKSDPNNPPWVYEA